MSTRTKLFAFPKDGKIYFCRFPASTDLTTAIRNGWRRKTVIQAQWNLENPRSKIRIERIAIEIRVGAAQLITPPILTPIQKIMKETTDEYNTEKSIDPPNNGQ